MFTVEWSCDSEFHTLSGHREILDMKQLECHIDNLEHGKRYYFRVACGNIRGFGNYRPSTPESVIPSSKYETNWYLLYLLYLSHCLHFRRVKRNAKVLGIITFYCLSSGLSFNYIITFYRITIYLH